MKNKLLSSGLLTFIISLLVVIYWALLKTNFNFTYPLDDSYIHLAIAKNLAQHGIWGVTKFEFTSASSSPLYTLIIATLIKLFGNNQYIPLLLNIGIGFGIVTIASKFIQEQFINIPKVYQYLVLNCFILFLPLHTLVFLAMEHTLHCLLVLLLFREFYYYLNGKLTNQYFLPLFAFLALSTRYETLFILLPIGLVFIYRKNYKLFLLVVLASSISIFGFGAYFISQGGRLLPYSVLVKGHIPNLNYEGLTEYIKLIWRKFKTNEAINSVLLFSLLVLTNSMYKNKLKINSNNFLLFLSILVIIIFHTLLGGYSYFYRYESYIMTLFIFGLAIFIKNMYLKIYPNYIIIVCSPYILIRLILSIYETPIASQNIYEQQIQMANYFRLHKEIKSVAINDIGVIAYFNEDLRILDLWALATPELSEFVIWEKKAGLSKNITSKMKKELVDKLCRKKNVSHVMMYPLFFGDIVQDNWQIYDTLLLKSKRVVCADTVVFCYKAI